MAHERETFDAVVKARNVAVTGLQQAVAFARQAYNDSVTEYNIYRQSFPPVVFAGMFGHSTNAELLQFDQAAIADAPKVSFANA